MDESPEHNPPAPSKWWYIGHAFLGVITGLACYVLYKDKNPQMARRHLITSIWFPIAVWVGLSLVLALAFPSDYMLEDMAPLGHDLMALNAGAESDGPSFPDHRQLAYTEPMIEFFI